MTLILNQLITWEPIKVGDLVMPLVTVVAVAVGIWRYRRTSKDEFVKPFREAQLKTYQEACSAAAQIATLPRNLDEWNKSRLEFLRLYFGPLATFEDFHRRSEENEDVSRCEKRDDNDELSVELAMIIFKSCMDNEPLCGELGGSLSSLSLALAHTCRQSMGKFWGRDIEQLRGDYQTVALKFWKKYNEYRKLHKEHSKSEMK